MHWSHLHGICWPAHSHECSVSVVMLGMLRWMESPQLDHASLIDSSFVLVPGVKPAKDQVWQCCWTDLDIPF